MTWRRPSDTASPSMHALRLFLLAAILSFPTIVRGQQQQPPDLIPAISASFTPCLQTTPQAPENEQLDITRIYAQLDAKRDTGENSRSGGPPDPNDLALRLVAQAQVGSQSDGFSNETNYLATVIVETNVLSFIPFSNQSALCSSIITGGSSTLDTSTFLASGGCPYGPGDVLIGYEIPLDALASKNDFYSLTTLSTRLRILDTSVPPLQLACVDVYTTPYYYGQHGEAIAEDVEEGGVPKGASQTIFNLVLWLPVASLLGYVFVNLIARTYASYTATARDHEAALASSLTTKLSSTTKLQRMKEVLLETAVGRSVIRSRSLTRFVTPGVGEVLAYFQWMALVGMCSVRWQGFTYPLFARLGWSMLLFNTTIVTPSPLHTSPTVSFLSYPPSSFMSNPRDLFTLDTSPFYLNADLASSNLLNLPSTSAYNQTNYTSSAIYPSAGELQGMASFSAMLGLRPQDLYANCLVFVAIILAAILVLTLLLPLAILTLTKAGQSDQGAYRAPGGRHRSNSSVDRAERNDLAELRKDDQDFTAVDLERARFSNITPTGSAMSKSHGRTGSSFSGKPSHSPGLSSVNFLANNRNTQIYHDGSPDEGGRRPGHHQQRSSGSSAAQLGLGGINRWWAGGDKGSSSNPNARPGRNTSGDDGRFDESFDGGDEPHVVPPPHHFASFWIAFFQGSLARLVLYMHLPITIFSVYQLSHATSTSSTVTIVFSVFTFLIFSLALPLFYILRIRKTLTRFLQDDTNTLLAFGPVYNTFAQDSYTFQAVRFVSNLVEGCVVGGAQDKATVQVVVVLVVEIVETIVTSIWLPWGDGAAQGPLQFILSVSRIITAVLLIVISPAVRLSFTARGWINYVIILIQVLVAILTLLILLVKILELLVRTIASIEFDESRSSKVGGLFGAFRKKGMLGFQRHKSTRRGGKNGEKGGKRNASDQVGKAVALQSGDPRNHYQGSRSTSGQVRRLSEATVQPGEVGFLSPSNRQPQRQLYDAEEESEEGHGIMSSWTAGGPSPRPDNGGFPGAPGYVPPGAYSAQPQASGSGFTKVRGGKASDMNPYTMQQNSLPAGAAARPYNGLSNSLEPPPNGLPSPPLPSNDSSDLYEHSNPLRRGRAASQSAIVEFFQANEDGQVPTTGQRDSFATSPTANMGATARHSRMYASQGLERDPAQNERQSRRLSAPLMGTSGFAPLSTPSSIGPGSRTRTSSYGGGGPSSASNTAWKRNSSTGSGFFNTLFGSNKKGEDDGSDVSWTDSDSDDEGANSRNKGTRRKWLFTKAPARHRKRQSGSSGNSASQGGSNNLAMSDLRSKKLDNEGDVEHLGDAERDQHGSRPDDADDEDEELRAWREAPAEPDPAESEQVEGSANGGGKSFTVIRQAMPR